MSIVVNCLAVIGTIVVVGMIASFMRGLWFSAMVEPGGRCPVCGGLVPLRRKP